MDHDLKSLPISEGEKPDKARQEFDADHYKLYRSISALQNLH